MPQHPGREGDDLGLRTISEKFETRRQHLWIILVRERFHELRGETLTSGGIEHPTGGDADRRIDVVEPQRQGPADLVRQNPPIAQHPFDLSDRNRSKHHLLIDQQGQDADIPISLLENGECSGMEFRKPCREFVGSSLRIVRTLTLAFDPFDQLAERLRGAAIDVHSGPPRSPAFGRSG